MQKLYYLLTLSSFLMSFYVNAEPRHYQMFINGEFRDSVSGRTREIRDPANQELIAVVPEGTKEDAILAIEAARHAYDNGIWRNMENKDREALLKGVAARIREKAEVLAELEVKNNGKPIGEARGDISATADLFEQYAVWAGTIGGEIVPVSKNLLCSVVYEPIGVCAGITPWNYPLYMTAWKVAPALATGNTVVLKPSELTPMTTLELAEIFHELKFPNGVINFITGTGAEVGSVLSIHPQVDKIAFTGGTETGQKVAISAATSFKRCSLELGGKSAQIVFADANLDKAIDGVMLGIFANQGEVCSAGSRLLIEESIHDQFVEKLVEKTSKIKLGHGLNPDTNMGPLVSSSQRGRVESYIKIGIDSGAKLLIGGGRPKDQGLADGYFIEPTIFDKVTPEMRIAQEEIFGPVLSIITFKSGATSVETEAHAIQIANDSEYGLAAGVWTENGARAERVTRELNVGIVWVNTFDTTANQLPWGGRKKSGYGRELGWSGLLEYLDQKTILKNIAP
jgi:betaine-aldehyde dehydrogenase